MTRVIGIVVLAGAALGFRSQYRIKEFRGDMMPVFVSTSELTDEEKLDAYSRPSNRVHRQTRQQPKRDKATVPTTSPAVNDDESPRPEIAGRRLEPQLLAGRDGIVNADPSNELAAVPVEVCDIRSAGVNVVRDHRRLAFTRAARR